MTELFHSLLDQTDVLKQLLESLTSTFSLLSFLYLYRTIKTNV